MKQVSSHFWKAKEEFWDTTFAMNKKGGMNDEMNDEEFKKCIFDNPLCCYWDAADVPESRVLLKCDLLPGRKNFNMLARICGEHWYLYPRVLNTTTVTHKTDQSSGLFKPSLQENLGKLTDDWLALEKSILSNSTVIGLLVFRGTDETTGMTNDKDVFAITF